MSDEHNDVPDAIRRAFAQRTYLGSRAMASLFEMSPRTLMRHVHTGNVTWRQKGVGTIKPRHQFALSDAIDLHRFLKRGGAKPCAANIVNLDLSRTKTRLSNTTISGSRVFGSKDRPVNVTKPRRK
jgi:hypothetical protein